MADWVMWMAGAGVVVILELLTGTFYLLMVAIGMLAGGLAALAGVAMVLQVAIGAAVGATATELLRRIRIKNAPKTEAERDPNVHMDIGQTIAVNSWQDRAARVMYRGAQWDVELAPGCQPAPGTFKISEIRGSRLIVANV